ncbi:MAG: BatD family protein [Marinobacterium sp.]|nr:BatD family protein [Marinobacterium sp.]
MVNVRKTSLALILTSGAALALSSESAFAELPTRLYPAQISEGEATQLTIELGDAPGGKTDLSPLEQDFQLLGRSQQSSTVINNGQMKRSTTLVLTLAPKRSGTLQIPAFMLEGDTTVTQTLVVRAPSKADQQALAEQVRIHAKLSVQGAYLQQPLLYTLRIELTDQLFDGGLVAPEVSQGAALIEPLGEQKQYRSNRGSQLIEVVEQDYLITPQRSGMLKISPAQLSGKIPQGQPRNTVFGPQYNRFRQVSLRSEAFELNIQPVPDAFKGANWLPATEVSLLDDWQMDSLEVGQPITRTLKVIARDASASQLPELKMQIPAGVRQYPEEAIAGQSMSDGQLVSTWKQQITLIPTQAGELKFPAVELHWWNTETGQQETARIDATSLQVAANHQPAASTPVGSTTPPSAGKTTAPETVADSVLSDTALPATTLPDATLSGATLSGSALSGSALSGAVSSDTSDPVPPVPPVPPVQSDVKQVTPEPSAADASWVVRGWMLVAAGLAVVVAGLVGWWAGRRSHPVMTVTHPEAIERTALPDTDALQAACQRNDGRAAQQALLLWCQQRWPQGGNLHQLQRMASPALKAQLMVLSQSLYSREPAPWQGDALWQAFQLFNRATENRITARVEKNGLVMLNPT